MPAGRMSTDRLANLMMKNVTSEDNIIPHLSHLYFFLYNFLRNSSNGISASSRILFKISVGFKTGYLDPIKLPPPSL